MAKEEKLGLAKPNSKNKKSPKKKTSTKNSKKRKKSSLSNKIWGSSKPRFNRLPDGFENWQETDRIYYSKTTMHLRLWKVERWQSSPQQTKMSTWKSGLRNVTASVRHKQELAEYEKTLKNHFPGPEEKLDLDI